MERSTGEILLGPPKSRAGRRVVGIPQAVIPVLREHLTVYVKDEPGALAFPGAQGGPLRRGNFNKMSAWPYAVRSVGADGLHFHDLRHTGNTFAERRGVASDASIPGKREDGTIRDQGPRSPMAACSAGREIAGQRSRVRTGLQQAPQCCIKFRDIM